jgi:hypothetical protein
LVDPEDNSCGDADCGHEGVGASVVAGVDAPQVLEPAEHDLDFVALSVQDRVVWDMDLCNCHCNLRPGAQGAKAACF